jgi:ABC-type transporter Mla subunit MlaD
MGDGEQEHSMLENLAKERAESVGREAPLGEGARSILADINHIRDHIQTLEEAARAAREVEFDQLRAVIAQLELVADAAKAVERDISQELSDTSRVSVATARVLRERLAVALRSLAEALATVEDKDIDPS